MSLPAFAFAIAFALNSACASAGAGQAGKISPRIVKICGTCAGSLDSSLVSSAFGSIPAALKISSAASIALGVAQRIALGSLSNLFAQFPTY